MSLYILEGPRGSGKSAVIDTVKNAFGPQNVCVMKFARTTSPPLHMVNFLMKYYLALIDSRTICVLDRFHLTEFVMRYLDKKVEAGQLLITTSMIDSILNHMGAVTYVLKTSQVVRKSRIVSRPDPKRRKLEWADINELDKAWDYATDNFSLSKLKIMPNNTQEDLDKIVIDIMKEQSKQTHLRVKKINSPALPIPIEIKESTHEHSMAYVGTGSNGQS